MEMMTIEQLAGYLHRDVREVSKLANRGKLPGQKVGGSWRFSRTEINHWLELQLPSYSDAELTVLESADPDVDLISALLAPESVAVPLEAKTRDSVIREMVSLAEKTWLVFDADAVLAATFRREQIASTALPSGVAIPHPHRPLPNAVGDSLIAYGRTARGIPFGGDGGQLTQIFFLVCCREEKTHLRVMARLARLLLRPELIEELHEAPTPESTLDAIRQAERGLVGAV